MAKNLNTWNVLPQTEIKLDVLIKECIDKGKQVIVMCTAVVHIIMIQSVRSSVRTALFKTERSYNWDKDTPPLKHFVGFSVMVESRTDNGRTPVEVVNKQRCFVKTTESFTQNNNENRVEIKLY